MKENLNGCLRNVTLRQLRAFAAVVEEGSITAAAERLHVTPPAISLQLRQLEELIGTPLLHRQQPKGYRPTDAGREMVTTVRRIERALSEGGDAIDVLRDGDAGRIVLGVISTAKYFAPRAVAVFKRDNPRVDIRLMVGNRGDMLEALEAYDLDLAIMGYPPQTVEVEREVIGEHPHVIVGPPDSPLAKGRRLRLADLVDETFLLRERGSGTRILVETLLAGAGLDPKVGMEIGSNETIKQAVIAGLGIGLLSAHTIAHEVREGRLAILDVEGLPVVRQWFVVRRREKRLLPAAARLWRFLVQDGRKHLPHLQLREGAAAEASVAQGSGSAKTSASITVS